MQQQELWITLEPTYITRFVVLSIVVACIAAFASFFINDQLKKNTLLSKRTWLTLAATTLGLGIWSMHFLGMVALQLPVMMTYNKWLTLFTVLPAIFSSFVAFSYVNQPRHTLKRAMIAGFFIGTGMALMHYVGMYAMGFEGVSYKYRYEGVILSYVAAVLLSVFALLIYRYVSIKNGIFLSRIASAFLLAAAVAVVHYTGMSSMVFEVQPEELQYHAMSESINKMFIYMSMATSLTIIAGLFLATFLVNKVFSRRLEYYDSLTGLPNILRFTTQIENNAKANAIVAIEFERMTEGACNYGLLYDEHLLKDIASALKKRLPSLTEMYRVRDYTFIVVAQDALAAKELKHVLETYLLDTKDGIVFEQKVFQLPAVIVMAVAETVQPYKVLYNDVLVVLDHPSTAYNGTLIQYDPVYHTRNFEAHLLEDLDNSLQNGDIFIVYQPKINPVKNELVSTEALIRWVHPEYGFLAPPVFLPILEAHGRLQDLTDWIIDEVCRQLAVWKHQRVIPQVGINIPGPYLTTNRLFTKLVEATDLHHIERHTIELEVTETSIVHSIEEAIKSVAAFRSAGFAVALDDFGTGVSSLSYLKQLAFSTLKIDKSFVDGILVSDKDKSILEAIVALGESLHMQLVIEGVEERNQVDYLISLSEDLLIQGYYYAKPMKPDDLQQWYSTF